MGRAGEGRRMGPLNTLNRLKEKGGCRLCTEGNEGNEELRMLAYVAPGGLDVSGRILSHAGRG
jgi:hypothetical protein